MTPSQPSARQMLELTSPQRQPAPPSRSWTTTIRGPGTCWTASYSGAMGAAGSVLVWGVSDRIVIVTA